MLINVMDKPIGERIREARIKKGLAMHELGALIGKSESDISRIETGRTANPGYATIAKLINALGLTEREFYGIYEDVSEVRLVPMLDLVQAGEWSQQNSKPYAGFADEYIETDLKGPNIFALRVKGDSMEPLFRDGETILINPDLEANPGDYVIAKIDADESATFKQLKRVGTVYFLHPLNPAYDDMPVTKKIRIVGKVVRSQKDW